MPYKDPPRFQLSWPLATVIIALAFMVMTSVTILALKGADIGAILGAVGALVVVVASIFGVNLHNKMDRVETISNGRLSEQIEQNQKLQEQVRELALRLPPPSPPVIPDPSTLIPESVPVSGGP